VSGQAALSLAVAALAAVVGLRLLSPRTAPGYAAALAYAASLAASWLGANGLVPGGAAPGVSPPMTVRLGGAALLVFGLVAAGRAAGGKRRAERKVLGGLALVLSGQVVRAPSAAGLAVLGAAAAVFAWAAWRAGPQTLPERMHH
jgi:hypothetical protein